MPGPVVHAADRRRTETPNAVMTTSASPSLSGSTGLSLWWVEMAAGATGPAHTVDVEQVWSLVEGSAQLIVEGVEMPLLPGDTATLPAGTIRQFTATSALRAVVCGLGTAIVSVPGEPAPRGTPPWIA